MILTCPKCRADKDSSEFYVSKKNRIRGFSYYCKECAKAKSRLQVEDPAKMRARCKAWARKNAEKVREQSRAKRLRNPESARAACASWIARNRDWCCDKEARRKAQKLNATPKWSEKDKIRMVYAKAKQYGLTVDHIVPLISKTVCGLHVWANLQLLDGKLNTAKHNRYWPDMPERDGTANLAAMTA